jgi:hypothetical protein
MQKQPQNAYMPAVKGCEFNDPDACAMLANFLVTGTGGVNKEVEKGLQLFERACKAGSDGACATLGTLLYTGELGIRNPQIGAVFLDRACRGGMQGACATLGVQLLGNAGVEKNWQLASALFKRACIGDDPTGCINYGNSAEFGIGVPKNDREAAAAYERACRLDERECSGVAIFFQLGKVVKKDLSQAVKAYAVACKKGDVFSCAILKVYMEPRVHFDVAEAKRYIPVWGGTCTSGVIRDCTGLAMILHAVGNHDEGNQIMLKACQLGDELACDLARNNKPQN